jgi:hypothetical protein
MSRRRLPTHVTQGIQINPAHKGRLHKDLGVPDNEPIPDDKLEEALNSPDPKIRRRAVFARNAKRFDHGL